LLIPNLLFKIKKKRKRAAELAVANTELAFQNEKKNGRQNYCCYTELFQNEEKENQQLN
jgi:hypothetical protein